MHVAEEPAPGADVAFVAALQRRRAASWRCEPLARTGLRDPFDERRPDLDGRREVLSWTAAVEHLAAHGHAVLWAVPDDVRVLFGEPAA